MTGRPLCKNSLCMIDSRAQYKVYEPIRTSARLHAGGWHTRAGHRFFSSVDAKLALLSARADRAAGRCTILFRYRIDHGTSLAQRRSAREESEPDPAWPSVASPLKMDLPDLETHVPLDAQRVTHFASDFDGHIGDGVCPCARQDGTVVPCRRQPWTVHAHNRVATRQESAEKFL